MKLLGVFFFLVFLQGIKSENPGAPTVKTKVGTIIGTTKEVNAYGRRMKVNRFFGIPYAEAPVDDLRFKKPVPKKPFVSPFKATQHGTVCLQMMLVAFADTTREDILVGEDCLNLNIYVPARNQGNLAVMIWLHGGGFFCGASDPYISDTLSAHGNVIVVTFNYRLSIWG